MLRQPAVAGMFYENNAHDLRVRIESLWPASLPPKVSALGAMVPHAGYMYSGRTAAQVYSRLEPAEVYILLGPNHTGRGWPLAISAATAWQTPLGTVELDATIAGEIMQLDRNVRKDETAHLQEHSLEVQLPFLQTSRRSFSIVPVILGTQNVIKLKSLGLAIAQAIQVSKKKCLVIASSDMNHFESLPRTKQLDEMALRQVLAMDAEGLLHTVHQENISMCGVGPVAAMLFAVRALGAVKAELIEYTTSAEFSGDTEQVVGYAGVIIS